MLQIPFARLWRIPQQPTRLLVSIGILRIQVNTQGVDNLPALNVLPVISLFVEPLKQAVTRAEGELRLVRVR